MTELEHAIKHIKTRADAWAVKEVEEALSEWRCIYDLKNRYCPRLDEHGMLKELEQQPKCDKDCEDMTREVAIKAIQDFIGWFKEDSLIRKALEMAIQALSQEPTFDDVCQKDMNEAWEQIQKKRKRIPVTLDLTPCDDAVSRDAVISTIYDNKSDFKNDFAQGFFADRIRELPPVTPKSTECGDAVSREMALKECHDIVVDGERYRVIQEETLLALPPVPPRMETVTEFADRCRECGARYGKLLKQLREQTRWIPVSERLPQKDDLYLICFDDGEYELDYFCIDTFSYSGVVAWMPLPKPYEPQESEEKE